MASAQIALTFNGIGAQVAPEHPWIGCTTGAAICTGIASRMRAPNCPIFTLCLVFCLFCLGVFFPPAAQTRTSAIVRHTCVPYAQENTRVWWCASAVGNGSHTLSLTARPSSATAWHLAGDYVFIFSEHLALQFIDSGANALSVSRVVLRSPVCQQTSVCSPGCKCLSLQTCLLSLHR